MGPQLALEPHPSGRRVRVIQMRALAVKALAPVFFFEGPFRQPDVGLRGSFAFLKRIHAPLPLLSIAGMAAAAEALAMLSSVSANHAVQPSDDYPEGVGHHGETEARLARAGRLHRGV